MGHSHSKQDSGSTNGTTTSSIITATSMISSATSTSSSKTICPSVDTSGPAIVPIVGNMKFHELSIIVSGVAAICSVSIALFLVFRHANHFSNPAEQKQIIRIINIVPVFALVTLLCVWLNGSPSPYISPALDVGEAFPMAAFFLLMSTYLMPDQGSREEFFSQLVLIDGKGRKDGQGSLQWYKRITIFVLQWIPVSIVLWIATAITLSMGTYCTTSNSVHFAHIWVTVIRAISTAMAIMAILRFYGRSKPDLKPRGIMKQLLSFKILVLLNFLQTFIFGILMSSGTLHANKYLTFNDLSHGIPSLLLSCEVALLSPFFLIAYSAKRYIISGSSPASAPTMAHYQGGPLGVKAIFSAINIIDIVGAMVQAIKGRGGGRRVDNPMQEAVPAYREGN